jgi:hypothetical protein
MYIYTYVYICICEELVLLDNGKCIYLLEIFTTYSSDLTSMNSRRLITHTPITHDFVLIKYQP